MTSRHGSARTYTLEPFSCFISTNRQSNAHTSPHNTMTSFVRRLAKSLSHDAGVRGPHDTRCPEPLSKMHSCPRQLPTSPSFNDFSLRAEEDGKHSRDATHSAPCRVQRSANSDPPFGRRRPPRRRRCTVRRHHPPVTSHPFFDGDGLSRLLGNSTFSESPVGSPTELTPSMVSALPKKTTRKIVGLDPYDFCDLLKSSSL